MTVVDEVFISFFPAFDGIRFDLMTVVTFLISILLILFGFEVIKSLLLKSDDQEGKEEELFSDRNQKKWGD